MFPVTYFEFTTLLFRPGFDIHINLPSLSYQIVTRMFQYTDIFYAGLSKQSPLPSKYLVGERNYFFGLVTTYLPNPCCQGFGNGCATWVGSTRTKRASFISFQRNEWKIGSARLKRPEEIPSRPGEAAGLVWSLGLRRR